MARILLADDEPAVSGPMSAQLMFMGHEVDVAENGKVAVERVRATEYDLIISDIRMPLMTGLEFLTAVMPQIENSTPCMVITGYHDVNHAIAAMRAGAVNLLLKPWDMQDLKVAVKQGLARRAEMKFRRDYQADLERRVQEAVGDLRNAYDSTVVGFAALLEGKDSSTADHCVRVRDLCSRMAREMGLGSDRIRNLELGAMLHDIGKFKIPDHILKKKSALDATEWVEMRKHAEYGAEILEKIAFLRGAIPVVRNHHEKWDGSGYPAGLRGDQIPQEARIFMVVDAYDAITSKRHYKEAQDPAHALDEIRRCSGTHFDPKVVEVFERIYDEIKAGTFAGMPLRPAFPSGPPEPAPQALAAAAPPRVGLPGSARSV